MPLEVRIVCPRTVPVVTLLAIIRIPDFEVSYLQSDDSQQWSCYIFIFKMITPFLNIENYVGSVRFELWEWPCLPKSYHRTHVSRTNVKN